MQNMKDNRSGQLPVMKMPEAKIDYEKAMAQMKILHEGKKSPMPMSDVKK